MAEGSKTFTGRCKDFFGTHPGQTLVEFKHELDKLDKLTPQDKMDLVKMFNDAGMPTDPPASKV